MKDLVILPSKQNPDLQFIASTGELSISGQSLPENVVLLYDAVLNWVDEYSNNPAPKTVLTFKMRYYNTATSRMFFSLIKKMNNMFKNGKSVEIQWVYQKDDEDMLDAGEYFRDLVDLPFKFISVE